MSLTAEAVKWHKRYEDASEEARQAIDAGYKACRAAITRQLWLDADRTPANDDRAEELVAAITRYYFESQDLEGQCK